MVQHPHDAEAGVQADEVRQCQGAHGHVGAQLQRLVDVLRSTNSVLKCEDRLKSSSLMIIKSSFKSSRKRSEGFPFIVWGSGGWTRVRFVCCVASFRRASSRGASLIPCRADLRFGRVARVPCVALCHGDYCWACRVGGAVSWGLLTRASQRR